ncbi:hypothetical protein MRB53_024673 [Persea americana]|uniref:Uncharacterized protein n=1 Tax=Persea americana TaxID=3435 RepID=A0ACC2LD15_PERAE|nr:hypothetical protein MRB53_024673 [Persea americana]
MTKAFSSHPHWYAATLNSLTNANHATIPALVYAYSHAIHGFSAILSPIEQQSLKKSMGVIAIHPDMPVQIHTTHTHEFMSLNSNWGDLWPASNYGEDVIIGIVDTGIWPESASFSDKGMTHVPARWKGEDTDGHGTHTSSTAAGSFVEVASFFGYAAGTASGMAPRARVAMYKDLWNGGIGYSSDVLAAIDQAIADGVDVISMSLGFGRLPFHQDLMAIASFTAMEKIAASAGNEGPAAVTCTKFSSMDANATALILDVPLIYNDSIKACDSITALSSAKDSIVFCDNIRQPLIQMSQVCDSGAAGAIIVTDVTFSLETADFLCPSVVISPGSEDLATLMKYLNTSVNPTASIKFQETILGLKPAPTVGAYSSRGPSLISPAILEPDLVAPGSRILAAYPPKVPAARLASGVALSSEFQLITGTSMACPHAAGELQHS